MAQTVHLKLTGQKAGAVDGESTQMMDERKDSIECFYFESAVTSPRDPGSGRATGRRQYAPIKIRKRIDKSSPVLAQLLTQNEECKAEFLFFRPDKLGKDEVFYSIKLSGAFVSSITAVMPDTLENPGVETREAYEEVTFTFDGITWEHRAAKKQHTDSWSGQPQF